MPNYAGEAGDDREVNSLTKMCQDVGTDTRTVNCRTKWDRRPSGLYSPAPGQSGHVTDIQTPARGTNIPWSRCINCRSNGQHDKFK